MLERKIKGKSKCNSLKFVAQAKELKQYTLVIQMFYIPRMETIINNIIKFSI
jgi:hypothetical protein